MRIEFTRLDLRAQMPRNAYGNDAGWDLFCLETVTLPSSTPVDLRTGIAVAIPDGYYGRIVHRSSAPRKRNIMVMEGIIDAGFRGELFACAYFLNSEGWSYGMRDMTTVSAGESIAQLIIQKVEPIQWVEVNRLPASLRGEKGFGSSGN